MAVPLQEADQADLRLPAIAIGMEIHLLVFDGAPKSFDQEVVVAALNSLPAGLDLIGLQSRHEVS
mgnify:CR=1 FL=1